jgi:hypothetical protein
VFAFFTKDKGHVFHLVGRRSLEKIPSILFQYPFFVKHAERGIKFKLTQMPSIRYGTDAAAKSAAGFSSLILGADTRLQYLYGGFFVSGVRLCFDGRAEWGAFGLAGPLAGLLTRSVPPFFVSRKRDGYLKSFFSRGVIQ